MKNLQLLELVHKPLDNIFSNAEVFSQFGDTTYFISNNSLHKHDFVHNATTELCPQNFEEATYLKFLSIENKICIVSQDKIHIFDPHGINEIHTLTFDNVAAISWNPTEEIVAIVSENGDVSTFSIDYENGEVFARGKSSIGAKIPDTVYVGWGSKETQFRGSEGKLKKKTPIETKAVEDRKPTISWRGNGEMFVVNYWTDEKRKFVVFQTPCEPLYRSEECPGLQPPVAWRPAGNMIATLTETDKQSIVIFEKNGQKRFSFDLDFGGVRVRQLKWSPCAHILTVLTENESTKSQTIHLLTSSNYKWYEKQTLVFKFDNHLLDFDWLETTQFTFTLRVVTKSDIIKYTFHSVVNNSSAVCGVIDGKNLHVTDFSQAVIPPIMSLIKITNSQPINFVTVFNNLITIVDSENFLKTFDVESPESVINSVNLEESVNNISKFPLACHHFISRNLDICFGAETSSETAIYKLSPQNNETNFIDATTDPLRHLVPTTQNKNHFVDLKPIDSDLYINNVSDKSIRQSVKMIDNKTFKCRLTSSCHFYVDDKKISDCVSSFIIFDDYLLFTTKLNQLYCLRFDDELLKSDLSQSYRRNIEQGATIIAAIPNSSKIVLQLPRGNLETISCRLISIDILNRLLNDQKWEEAIRFIRLEKLNANLLFDLDSKRFLEQIDRFIDGVKTINELNSLCLEFESGNVLNTIYKNWGKSDEYPGKIDAIFGEIFKCFDKVDYVDYVTIIMAIHLTFFTLRGALVYLQDLLRRCDDDVTLKQKLNEAINTLKMYGCDQEKLYTEALLLYDLDLAHFVASCCQLDPRIYEPHLNNLKNLTEVERRYEINLYAKKPKSAIAYLLRCPETDSEKILDFVKNHNVGREAYESCQKNNRHYQVVSRAFAQDLSRRGCHREAGVILKRANLSEEALEEFKLSLQWREVLKLLEELKVGEVEKMRVANEMAKQLEYSFSIKDSAKEAAILYEYYANNYEMAVKILLNNYYFEDAILIAKKHNRGDIIVSDILPLLKNHKKCLERSINWSWESLKKYKERLVIVRRSKVDKLSNFSYEEDRDDLFSDADSTISKSSRSSRSRSSTASSRKRRKEERKKQDLREGGIYEDIALIRALHYTINEIYKTGERVRSSCFLLLQETDVPFEEVKIFHDAYWKIHADAKSSLEEIWPPHFSANFKTQNAQEAADLDNFEHLDAQYRTPPADLGVKKLDFF